MVKIAIEDNECTRSGCHSRCRVSRIWHKRQADWVHAISSTANSAVTHNQSFGVTLIFVAQRGTLTPVWCPEKWENRKSGVTPERAQRCNGDGLSQFMPLGNREGALDQMIQSQKTGQIS